MFGVIFDFIWGVIEKTLIILLFIGIIRFLWNLHKWMWNNYRW